MVVVVVALLVATAITSFEVGRKGYQPYYDTTYVTVYDTQRYIQPIPVDSYVICKRVVTLPRYYDSVITAVDSVRVEIPIERKIYSDSAYYAVVSGYKPNLDSLFVRNKTITRIITHDYTRKTPRWAVGPMVGVGVNTSGRIQPYVGFGVTYNILNHGTR